jgi:short-subunit dehydrogenase
MAKRGKDIKGQLALITGAGRGIGLATALELSRAGARIAIAELDQNLGETGARAVRDAGGEAHGYVLDVTDRARFDAVVAEIERERGPIDILVNNAGIMTTGAFLDHGQREDQAQISVNLMGVVNGMRAVIPRMQARRRGHIVNIASMAGRFGTPYVAMYSATKFGVIGLTEAVRGEMRGSGIDFTYVMPSLVNTELIAGTGRPLWPPVVQPESVARAVRRALTDRLVEVYVPSVGKLSQLLPVVLPRAIVDWASARLNVWNMFHEVDRGKRAAYVARTSSRPAVEKKNGQAAANGNGKHPADTPA